MQTSARPASGLGLLDSYTPLGGNQTRLYYALREAVPIIDAAIFKTVRLTGGFEVRCADERLQDKLDNFVRNVPVGGNQCGLESFVSTYFEQLLTCGTAVGEMVTDSDGHIAALPQPGEVCGCSMLKGLPFVSGILMKIYKTIGLNWERMGNIRFAVTYKPQNGSLDRAYAKERAMQVAKEWSEAMQTGGAVKDFVAVGDVQIKVIGADNQILDSEVPVRQMLEQIVAKTGLPPFMLGLSWSSTERMSTQQADVLTSEIDAYRRILTPVIERICRTYLLFEGTPSQVTAEWDDVTLQDNVELARAELYAAQAEKIRKEIENGE